MSETYLHGVEIVEVDDGSRPISTVRSSVIGIVGTAPDSAPEVKASLATGQVSSNNALTWTSKLYGALGNDITLKHTNPGTNNATLAVTVSGKAINVSLATGATGLVTTTAALLISAVAASEAANALVGVANTGASTGAGLIVASPRTYSLTGGEDEPFPIGKPRLIAGDIRLAAKLGAAGTLYDAVTGIFKQSGAVVVIVRVEEGADAAATMQNVIGGVDLDDGSYTGCWAFLGAENETGFCPRILCAPGFTHQYETGFTQKNAVVAELEAIAPRLRAIIVADGPNTTDANAIKARNLYGNKRVYMHDPFYALSKDGDTVYVPASGYISGLIARIDNEQGFWNSPSNKEIYGIIGTQRPIDFTLGDTSSRANLLNEQEVAVTIRKDGFRLWGNRTTSGDPKWAFLSVVRTADMINESLLRAHMWAVDRNITRTYFDDVAEGVNAYLAKLKNQGAILDGKCWVEKDLNTQATIGQGQAIFSFDFQPPIPCERLTFRSMMNGDYLDEILS